jgi:hypothetical protein
VLYLMLRTVECAKGFDLICILCVIFVSRPSLSLKQDLSASIEGQKKRRKVIA